jgi:uncharacterized membrane protein
MNNHQKAMKQTAKPQEKAPKRNSWKAASLLCDVQLLLTAALEVLVLMDKASGRVTIGAELALTDLLFLAALLMLGLSHCALSAAKRKDKSVPKPTTTTTTVPEKGEEEAISYSYFDITQFRHNIRPDHDIPPDD